MDKMDKCQTTLDVLLDPIPPLRPIGSKSVFTAALGRAEPETLQSRNPTWYASSSVMPWPLSLTAFPFPPMTRHVLVV
ncbi:hypothetical protein N7475_005224 [Penicillium sp. IBT 31633x]|nr:hypothetical protein N7475_005224 [Penicillium sp. IBT 31633x]